MGTARHRFSLLTVALRWGYEEKKESGKEEQKE